MKNLIINNEIAFDNEEDAIKVAQILMKQFYVVMLSKEEELTIVNYCYSTLTDRNDVVFLSRDDFYDNFCELVEEENENG